MKCSMNCSGRWSRRGVFLALLSAGAVGFGSSGGSSWVRTRLVRPAEAPDADAKGTVDARSGNGHEELVIEGEMLTPDAVVNFFLQDGEGTLQQVASDTVESDGEVKARWKLEDGGLPFSAATVAELSGRGVELRDAEGNVLLQGAIGTVPAVSQGRKQKAVSTLVNVDMNFAPRGKGAIKVEVHPRRDENRLTVKLEHVPRNVPLELHLTNPETDELEKVGDFVVEGTEAKIKINTRSGQPLPFGVASVGDLSGLALEVRTSDGTPRFSGVVPTLAGDV